MLAIAHSSQGVHALERAETGLQLVIGGNDHGFDGMVFAAEGRHYSDGHPRVHIETTLTLALSEPAATTPRSSSHRAAEMSGPGVLWAAMRSASGQRPMYPVRITTSPAGTATETAAPAGTRGRERR